MSLDFLPPIQSINLHALEIHPLENRVSTRQQPLQSFGELVANGLARVSRDIETSHVDMQKLATGDVADLHQVMLRLEQSRLSFQLMMQVRNRLLESYQEVMRMQV